MENTTFNHLEIDQKWQKFWDENKFFKTLNPWEEWFDSSKEKFYVLDMFPYPSWAWLHVGHPKWYISTDIFSRYKRMKWFNVLHPMWWDAFWLPAENYAIKTWTHPSVTTRENVQNYIRQIKSIWFSYDWDREINTTDEDYYKWTQWIFLKLFEKWLAYETQMPINWCPSCKTWLANEEVVDWECDRCWTKVEKKNLRQWMLKITEYAPELLEDLETLPGWTDSLKSMQRNWIWKSEWCEFEMKKFWDENKKISVYTTRVDTVFWMTYAVLAPDHKDVQDFITEENKTSCEEYIEIAAKKSDMDRTELAKEKTWVFTGSFVINPFNWEKVPLWIWDYVLWNYWTWAVMAVPAHDERDFEFAKKYDLEIKQSVAKNYILDWKSKSRDDVETLNRKVIDVIIENEKWEFLLLKEKDWNFEHCHFVWWWIEDWETELEAVKKEIIEETWYTDFEIISDVNLSFKWCFWFRHTKNKNQKTIWRFFHVKLKWENRIHSEVEDWNHEMEWFFKDEISKKITWPHHLDWWNLFLSEKSFTEDWILVDSQNFDWLASKEARNKLSQFAEENNFWTKKTNFKLRDWVFSRQRYWWEPIPVVHCDDCGLVAEKEENLPLTLPKVEKYEPSWTWESPLANIDEWVNCKCPKCWKAAKRETNTMPQWAWSSWYYLRFMDPKNSESFVWKEVEKYWGQVDMYVWWAEHAVLHLLYARFWHKVLFDLWIVSYKEPFKELRNQWLIMAEWWEKMSKSKWNVVNPDDIISEFWADTLRLYEMFMWPFDQNIAWDTKWIKWVKRFLDKVWNLRIDIEENFEDNSEVLKILHQTIKKVWEKIENFEFNTAISDMMVFVNLLQKQEKISKNIFKDFIKILNPFAPHLTEELNEFLWEKEKLSYQNFPEFNEKFLVDNEVTFAIQVNWKVRAQLEADKNISKENALSEAKKLVEKFLDWKEVRKEIFVPWKIIWFVV